MDQLDSQIIYIKPGLEMPKNTEWQKQISTECAQRSTVKRISRA